jgi:predicted dehydrogenase
VVRRPIEACDLHGFVAKDGRQVKPLPSCDLSDSDLVVIASPGPAHTEAIERLRMASGANVLVEKPLCYSAEELAQWRSFAADHSGRVLVCHNYRYKRNVVEMVRFLKVHPPGALHHVHLDFSSPAVTNDSVAWMRNERRARTLLLDYSLHFVDIACMFARPETRWEIDHCRHELNARGQTSVIEGNVRADYSVSFVLRQGFAPRRTRLLFTFQNYSVSLGFFPETFVPHMSNDSPWLYKREQKVRARATRQKILDKLLNRDSDMSHAAVFAAAGAPTDAAPGLTVERVAPFYDLLFRLADRVYGAAGVGPGGEVAAAPAAPNPTGAGSRRIEARTAT